ncbi:hypothetical protein ACHAWF_003559 [Thalassiosira exigua]
MSSSFASPNLYGQGAASKPPPGNASLFAPPLGLRQRHPSATARDGGAVGGLADENADPNSAPRSQARGKWESMNKVRAPPRVSLATAGARAAFAPPRSATPQREQQSADRRSTIEPRQQSIVPSRTNGEEDEDLSLWVVGYGYRNEAHFRALYHRLESCGVINARRGGLSCFGEVERNRDDGSNWVAVRYENALCAHKALSQHGNFVNVGGSIMVVGVMPLTESNAAANLGINVNRSFGSENVTLIGRDNGKQHRQLLNEADILLDGGQGGDDIDSDKRSGFDSLCGKILAWFFGFETHSKY